MVLNKLIKIGAIAAAVIGSSAAYSQEFITIGTGAVTGVYYPTGGAICRLVNRDRQEHNIRCSVESTGGSIYNVNTMRSGELDFAIVQSDWQYHGYNGTSQFSELGPYKKLRAMFSLHTEPFNIITRADSGINNVKDLEGKRVNIGNPGSGDRATMQVVMDAFGWTNNSFRLASELRGAERSQALCDNRIDAFIYMVGHPNGAIQEATTSCNAKLVSATGPEVTKIVTERPYYAYSTIPAGMYRGTDNDVTSFGVAATLVTSTDVSDEVAYNVAKAVFENFDTFTRLHPAFANLKKEDMVQAGLSIPLHPGAEKYYKEVGLLK
ncbi:TAXI family TRAP transporter solute-binding subunit [Vibrio cincinnatiensis]|uniref:TRAP transporter solute receptor, TAXI family n=1 Tax=Vibrio cincinnatiensis DSM 19608 TaxID=1123491 RepID=A0A1T4QH49_VIBCI|nr:TAXI family TRAP transporter solute-binding subunit [Vibrio cincinnatiensis]MCG3721817.1 TAXI family TRAP transporter solute-binding subunit [Vibrio cincinnatiensis]MCG3726796.1 TAXI family TRAP transporter solute-binding subunit [Vibrio cincinnatiensis]MCG3733718.1 TAXI family TRAP transporter solute-binding subunit [Vibrio cincinnatiensis]MCG3737326.1 TAXI family TRAP transporter solute-binding subunit [Vibrio cincinnatiensis]MCG3740241.1 TAXI family TRAP transporter solute-binding subuni